METTITLILTTITLQLAINCFLNRNSTNLFGILNCIFSLTISALSIYTAILFAHQKEGFLKITLGIFKLNIEPLTIIFICMLSILWFISNIYSYGYLYMNPEINIKKFNICTTGSILSALMIGLSENLLITFAFYELLTIFTYPLVANTNTKHEKTEARFYLYFLIATSAIILFPLILFIGTSYGTVSFTVGGIIKNNYTYVVPLIILALYGAAKAAIIPAHFWLPRAMVAPVPVSALLHAVAVVKSGVFIILKMYIYIFGINIVYHLPSWKGINIITLICAISLIISSIIALYQVTLKKLLAYSTINQLSLCLLAASLFTINGIKASVLHLLSHAVGKITLFFAVGYIYSNARITRIDEVSGVAKKLPIISMLFSLGALSIIGLPPLSGFISKAYIIYAALTNNSTHYFIITLIVCSILLSTHYFGKIIYKLYFEKMDTKHKAIYSENTNSTMILGTSLSAILICTYILIYPYIMILLERIKY